MQHEYSRTSEGKNEDTMITPQCSCGWKGRAESVMNDYCYTNAEEQWKEHYYAERDKLERKYG